MIEGGDAHHLARSLRARVGEEVDVIDPAGFLLTVRLETVSPELVEGAIVAERPHNPEPRARVTLAVANLPAPALELVLSRCTEAGAHSFVVFNADRSVGRGDKPHRWLTICREAAMLAGRLRVPEVSSAPSLAAVLRSQSHAIVLDRSATRSLAAISEPRDVTLVIGPEGGWSDTELSIATDTATLGPRNMRADTAALVALAVALGVREQSAAPSA